MSVIFIASKAGRDGSVKQIMGLGLNGRRSFSHFVKWQSLQRKMPIKRMSDLYRLVTCGCLILNYATGLKKHG